MKWRTRQAYTAKKKKFAKIVTAVNYFCKTLHRRCLRQGSEYAPDFEYATVLNIIGFWMNIPGLWICLWFSICQGSGDHSHSLTHWSIYHGSKYVRVTQRSDYAWIIPGYAWLCLNGPKSVWMAFALHLPIVILYLKKP